MSGNISLWRALPGILPDRNNLNGRGVNCESAYVCCEIELEIEWHCFSRTLTVEKVWSKAGLWSHIFSLLERMLQKALNRNDKIKFVTLLWIIWLRRNRKCWDTIMPSSFDVNKRAIETIDDWVEACKFSPNRPIQ